ncbi:MAG: MarR family transcriptional regulator [bacterium]
MNTEIKEIIGLSEKFLFEIVAREKQPIILPDGEKIYRFEIHLIDLIGKNEGITVNELAKLLNVTKGAVSQVITKLDKNNIVNKIKTANNRKNVNLYLTTKGKAIFEGHKQFHDNIDNKIVEKFSKYSKNEIELIKSALGEVQNILSGI